MRIKLPNDNESCNWEYGVTPQTFVSEEKHHVVCHAMPPLNVDDNRRALLLHLCIRNDNLQGLFNELVRMIKLKGLHALGHPNGRGETVWSISSHKPAVRLLLSWAVHYDYEHTQSKNMRSPPLQTQIIRPSRQDMEKLKTLAGSCPLKAHF